MPIIAPPAPPTVSSTPASVLPVGVQFGQAWALYGPDGTRCVFNAPSDSDYVGVITDVSGFDSPDIRENADDLVQADGGIHGDFFYGRRPITLTGKIYDAPDAATRNARIDKLLRATNATRYRLGDVGNGVDNNGNSALYWIPDGGEEVFLLLRRQQPLRITGGYAKDFQIQMVAADPRIYSLNQYNPSVAATSYAVGGPSNSVPNPSFEYDALSSAPVGWGTFDNLVTSNSLYVYNPWAASGGRSMIRGATFTSHAGAYAGVSTGLGTAGMPVVAGTTNSASCVVNLRNFPAGCGPLTMYLIWYNASSTYISTTTGTGTSSLGVSTLTVAGAVAPAGAAFMSIAVSAGFAGAGYLEFWSDAFMLSGGATAPAYFDGDYSAYEWSGTPGNSWSGVPNNQLLVTNKGNTASYPIITVSGPITHPVLYNHTERAYITTTATLASSTDRLVIDTLNRTITLNGVPAYSLVDFSTNSWWNLAPGVNALRLAQTSFSAGASAAFVYRDAWI